MTKVIHVIAEPCSHLCKVGGQHVVRVWGGPHHHNGFACLSDTGEHSSRIAQSYYVIAKICSEPAQSLGVKPETERAE